MAVYTEVSFDEAGELLKTLNLGQLQSLEGCAGGIENTNYFATTDQGDYVLTLFERLTSTQLPFYLKLMKHLAVHGVPVPDPAADPQGDLLYAVNGKPATVVNRLRGKSELAPSTAHCAEVGAMMARMHLAGRDFEMTQPNLRGLPWWNETVPVVLPHLDALQSALIRSELAYQNHFAASSAFAALPRGPVHADLFRDNVMFETHSPAPNGAAAPEAAPALTGFFDFYFAGVDTFAFDIGVALNDWCIDLQTGATREAHQQAFLDAYSAVRPLSGAERLSLPAMRRAGALRFWISRLWDFHLPREASMLKAHDPTHFERVLRELMRELA
jgi:homoserine kinase type II